MKWFSPIDEKTKLTIADCICTKDKRFYIAKSKVLGLDDFMLWDRKTIVGHWPTSQQAKDAAAKIVEAEPCQV